MAAAAPLFLCWAAAAWAAAALADAAPPRRGLGLEPRRPALSTWRRTQCGSPTGTADLPTRWASDVRPDEPVLPAYPRPQMVRWSGGQLPTWKSGLRDTGDEGNWASLNGLWEWASAASATPAFGSRLNGSILVPFPVESCLSGVAPKMSEDVVQRMWYRLTFDCDVGPARTLLHFGAVDWQTTVYLNGKLLGNHTGGFDGFFFDITAELLAVGNELLVYVFDPSDTGAQPNGKQRLSAIDKPGGDTYSPVSGIWQTVWLERVPELYIRSLKIDQASASVLKVAIDCSDAAAHYVAVSVGGGSLSFTRAGMVGPAGLELDLSPLSPEVWSPDNPRLYDLHVTLCDAAPPAPCNRNDTVVAYFGLRTFALGTGTVGVHPLLNGKYTFLAGVLDQSWWPDGQYAAPTDAALESDLIATKMFGFNMIRLHQKVNPERWYYHADRHGIVVFQDMPQKYGSASPKTVPYFMQDLEAMIRGRGNHPCIVQWTAFNEGDCWKVFNVQNTTDWIKVMDPTRLVDTDSGGGANDMHIADVNDIHDYPGPGDPYPLMTQYAMVGEFGGLGAFVAGKEWKPGGCYAYETEATPADMAARYAQMAETLQSRACHVSAAVYTQLTDVELECDGFLNFDRTNKFTAEQVQVLRNANEAMVNACAIGLLPGLTVIS